MLLRPVSVLGCLVLTALLLAGCREGERNRAAPHEKGIYSGPADETLKEEQLKELRDRVGKQL